MSRLSVLVALVLMLTGCFLQFPGLLMPQSGAFNPYGALHPVGESLDCGCFKVRSFDEYLRSKPRAHGDDTYIGYLDLGWAGKSQPWVVFSATHANSGSVPKELRAFDPKHARIWDEAVTLSGRTDDGITFEAYLPGKQTRTAPNSWDIHRKPLLLRGVIFNRCGKRLLVMAASNSYPFDEETFGNPQADRVAARKKLAESLDSFLRHIDWTPSPSSP